jgi:hypothetical protein
MFLRSEQLLASTAESGARRLLPTGSSAFRFARQTTTPAPSYRKTPSALPFPPQFSPNLLFHTSAKVFWPIPRSKCWQSVLLLLQRGVSAALPLHAHGLPSLFRSDPTATEGRIGKTGRNCFANIYFCRLDVLTRPRRARLQSSTARRVQM